MMRPGRFNSVSMIELALGVSDIGSKRSGDNGIGGGVFILLVGEEKMADGPRD